MLTKKPFYPFLFILFYLLSNVIEVRKVTSFTYFLETLVLCTISLILLAACFYPFYKSWAKCFLFSFIALFFYLQYGSIHTAILKIKAFAIISHHSVLLVLIMVLLLFCFFIIKKYKIHEKLISPLNIAYIFLALFIALKLIYTNSTEKTPFTPTPTWVNTKCDTCNKPDIYLVVYDEYASSVSLKRRFNFDNTVLDSFLTAEKFHTQINSKSNYNITDCSMLSFFNADYLSIFKTKNYYTRKEGIEVQAAFKKTNFINYLQNNHYNIYNYSFFPLLKNGRETENSPIFSSHLLLANSLYYTLARDAGAIIIEYKLYKNIFNKPFYHQKRQIELLRNNFLNKISTAKNNSAPSFYYLHQLSPHEPFYYDKNGNETNFKVSFDNKISQAYLEYAQYCNQKIIETIRQIKKVSNNNAVIIFMGDHGYRALLPDHDKELFANQNAIYFPDQDYHLLYDSVSNVNLTRIILNKYFKLGIPLLKDSSIFINNTAFIENK